MIMSLTYLTMAIGSLPGSPLERTCCVVQMVRDHDNPKPDGRRLYSG